MNRRELMKGAAAVAAAVGLSPSASLAARSAVAIPARGPAPAPGRASWGYSTDGDAWVTGRRTQWEAFWDAVSDDDHGGVITIGHCTPDPYEFPKVGLKSPILEWLSQPRGDAGWAAVDDFTDYNTDIDWEGGIFDACRHADNSGLDRAVRHALSLALRRAGEINAADLVLTLDRKAVEARGGEPIVDDLDVIKALAADEMLDEDVRVALVEWARQPIVANAARTLSISGERTVMLAYDEDADEWTPVDAPDLASERDPAYAAAA